VEGVGRARERGRERALLLLRLLGLMQRVEVVLLVGMVLMLVSGLLVVLLEGTARLVSLRRVLRLGLRLERSRHEICVGRRKWAGVFR
jgi:hypothetical protein